MNEWTKKIILRIVGILIIIILGIWGISNSIQSERSRRLLSQYHERIAETERENRELGTRIEQCQSICRELECSVERNINSASAAIELIEDLRVQVFNLELVIGDFDWNKYYQYYDNMFFGE